jgi:hypothetical protein
MENLRHSFYRKEINSNGRSVVPLFKMGPMRADYFVVSERVGCSPSPQSGSSSALVDECASHRDGPIGL